LPIKILTGDIFNVYHLIIKHPLL